MKLSYFNVFLRAWVGLLGCCLIFSLSTSASANNEKQIYRYKNEKGELIFNSHIPKKFASKGYTIINIFGDVIEEVPAALTEEEKAKLAETEKEFFDKKEKIRLKAEADKKLLTQFAEPEDAERARDRQLETIDIYIGITNGNIKRLQADLAVENEKAADRERSGKSVSKDALGQIRRIKDQIAKAELFIDEQEQEKNDIRQAFDIDIRRLKELGPVAPGK